MYRTAMSPSCKITNGISDHCRPKNQSNLTMADFTGNYLDVAIQGKTRRKQNRTLAGMSAKSDLISANPA